MVSGPRFGRCHYQYGDLQGDKGDDGALVMIRTQHCDVGHVGQATYKFEKVEGIFPDPELPSKQMQCSERRDNDKAGSGQNGQNDFFEGD